MILNYILAIIHFIASCICVLSINAIVILASFAKYILKGIKGYKYIKLFIAESVFYYIKNSYMFN